MRLHRRNGDLKRRYRMHEVPRTDSWRKDIRCRYTVEPDNVERSSWTWRVWLEFEHVKADGGTYWMVSLTGYSEGATFRHPAPNTVQGRTDDQGTADEIARAVVTDVLSRRAANEALAQAQEAFGSRGQVAS